MIVDHPSFLVGADEDFAGKVSVLALGLLGVDGRCHGPQSPGCGEGRGAALAWGARGFLEDAREAELGLYRCHSGDRFNQGIVHGARGIGLVAD